MTVEFVCCECGRHIVAIAEDKPPTPPLCAACLMMPGWQDIPEIRAIIDRDYVPP